MKRNHIPGCEPEKNEQETISPGCLINWLLDYLITYSPAHLPRGFRL